MTARTPGRRSRGDAGQSLVEFALIVPILLILVFAMLEFGLAFNDKLTLGNATREGARVGSALVTVPLRWRCPPPGTLVSIPPPFLPFRETIGPDGTNDA